MSNELTTCKEDTCTTSEQTSVRPHYELDRNDEAFRINVYIPGSSKTDVNLSINEGTLSIQAKRGDAPSGDWKPLRRELRYDSYRLDVKLPEKVDAAKIGAKVEDGILALTLPIREADKPRNIEIS